MLKRRLARIATWLEKGAKEFESQALGTIDGFHMGGYVCRRECETTCETTCCIAGAAFAFYSERDVDDGPFGSYHAEGQRLLGLTADEADKLFTPAAPRLGLITPAQAALVIRRFIRTGKVSWSGISTKRRKV